MRWLGIDFGKTRIGLAVMESEFGVATARTPLLATGTLRKDADLIDELAKREGVDALILGIPLEYGEDGKSAKIIRMLGQLLVDRGWEVDFVDESMTSHESEAAMAELGMKASEQRARVDGESACRILERYQVAG